MSYPIKWLIPGGLAGGPLPGSNDEPENDIAAIRRAGIDVVVSLFDPDNGRESRFAERDLKAWGLEHRALAVPDFGVPDPDAARDLVCYIDQTMASGRGVLVHCGAGLGRTGTVMALCLRCRDRHLMGEAAIARVKSDYDGEAIQNAAQRSFVRFFHA